MFFSKARPWALSEVHLCTSTNASEVACRKAYVYDCICLLVRVNAGRQKGNHVVMTAHEQRQEGRRHVGRQRGSHVVTGDEGRRGGSHLGTRCKRTNLETKRKSSHDRMPVGRQEGTGAWKTERNHPRPIQKNYDKHREREQNHFSPAIQEEPWETKGGKAESSQPGIQKSHGRQRETKQPSIQKGIAASFWSRIVRSYTRIENPSGKATCGINLCATYAVVDRECHAAGSR